ncbi:MAG: bacillithiol biosynthesis cysteine-adding enzyme BshC [Flavobacteriaceae bacterium]|nr:bacillithiol biosynthesis cysteine-adding enzyme BshC [Flavobacteriaceae bacterium]
MPKQLLPYRNTNSFSNLICDYLDQKDGTKAFYGLFPSLENFKQQAEAKKKSFGTETRELLVKCLKKQYNGFQISEETQKNLEALKNTSTFTITTGHQLNLFTGPLYFLYKIFSVINLSEELNSKHASMHFVPVYWMATEDHDFEEINYFNFAGKKMVWEKDGGGAVGEYDTKGLKEVYKLLKLEFGQGESAQELLELFESSYLNHRNLADATRNLANELFKEYGLVIVDGNDAQLKSAFVPFAEKELTGQLGFQKISKTSKRLVEAGYAEQVHPREINLFYLNSGLRERIIEKDGHYFINDTEISFSKEEILDDLNSHPERFSPNALLRPLYQEVILPNICYTGGGGELAYWFQLKEYFEELEVEFPILLLRNSALLVSQSLHKKLDKLNVDISELFMKPHELASVHTKRISEIEIDFSPQREHLQKQFEELYQLAKKTDASFLGAVGAQEKKQLNGLDHLEKRLLKAQKRKLKDELERLELIQSALFPNENLQERAKNFSEFYLEQGSDLLKLVKENLDPLANEFTIIYT